METALKKHGRKTGNFFINPAFQWRFLGLIVSLLVILSGIVWVAVESFFRQFEEMGRSAALPPDHVFFTFLAKQHASLNLMMGLALLAVLGIGVVFGVWFSHRIAGPLYRLDLSLKKIRDEKKLSPIQFRDGDFFQEIPTAFNQMVSSLESQDAGREAP